MKKTASKTDFDNNIAENNTDSVETDSKQQKNDTTIVELALKTADSQPSELPSIREIVARNLEQYFVNLGDQAPSSLYQMVINEVEPALLQSVIDYTHGNQSRAAEILGLNRGTLRKKLKQHGIA